MANKEYTSEELRLVATRCSAAEAALTAAADARYICETIDDTAAAHAFGDDARQFAKAASSALFDLRRQALALLLGLDVTDVEASVEPRRLRDLAKRATMARARCGGSPSVDWGNAAWIRFDGALLERWASEREERAQ